MTVFLRTNNFNDTKEMLEVKKAIQDLFKEKFPDRYYQLTESWGP